MAQSFEESVFQTVPSQVKSQASGSGWFFPREQIEKNSPSRNDGISLAKENQLRKSYCVFLQDLGMRLKVPQLTIATSIIFCHRFFLRQSHAKNDRYMIATACMFLAGKVEETPKLLQNVLSVSYEIRHKKDKVANPPGGTLCRSTLPKEVYEDEKERVLLAENLVLRTLDFDLNIIHPYKRLVSAVKKLNITQKSLTQVAWNFLNDGLRTSLCLQYEAHQIAAGSIFLAAKFLKIKLPIDGERPWWQVLEVNARELEDVSNQMLELYEQHRDPSSPSGTCGSVALSDAPPTPQVAEKKFVKSEKKEERINVSGDSKDEVSNLQKSPCVSTGKISSEVSEIASLDITVESKRTHPRCGAEDCQQRETKRQCSGLVN
ncbi:hypothetical protein KP509_32G005000 [Ceratopteris richardii]|uniref:Cyclin-like domain-containing protein n=1 Tax=Ceratopteris richardii TaxID=49495 RepID=A0A8T2QQZ8_CERRI|nr:hypothetical protein KP509_32G005000 [Ceratopteris richardii]KAH7286386.1 hypothetical protein KP509_32G005000 [Ceratopteris richardii]KAH7286387.1 hypothetical protein KP509_32G005000 [Ceratopteris richardii]KAH7286388.1 hypothetical protein KP509_32G005000 [Ceratopteris richardii]KAH7286389.1 hypothetical protein KP509_32G005000 [Ceratopteris richardii]